MLHIEGCLDSTQREWLADKLDTADTPLVLCHHNLPAVTDQLRSHREKVATEMALPPTMREVDTLVDVLADGGSPLVLTGHFHLPLTGVDRGVREIAVPTTCSFPQSHLLLDITPTGTEIRLVPVADTDGLELAHEQRATDSPTARGLTAIGAARLVALPLVERKAE